MRLLITLAAILWMPLAAAGGQNHECQGGHNCNGGEGGGSSESTSVSGAISGSTSGAVASGGDSSVGDTAAEATSSSDVVNNLSLFGGGGGEGGSGGVDGQSTNGTGTGNILSPSTVVSTTTSNKYREAPRAYAGTASGPKDIDCRTFLGFDFRGATEDGAGGATFAIPLRERKDCKFERQAARAFAKDDLELGWANHCRSPTNLESLIMVARVVHNETIDEDGAFKNCMTRALVNPPPEDPGLPKT